jgi:hypothetical protein
MLAVPTLLELGKPVINTGVETYGTVHDSVVVRSSAVCLYQQSSAACLTANCVFSFTKLTRCI